MFPLRPWVGNGRWLRGPLSSTSEIPPPAPVCLSLLRSWAIKLRGSGLCPTLPSLPWPLSLVPDPHIPSLGTLCSTSWVEGQVLGLQGALSPGVLGFKGAWARGIYLGPLPVGGRHLL